MISLNTNLTYKNDKLDYLLSLNNNVPSVLLVLKFPPNCISHVAFSVVTDNVS